jgi:hypothetical protein
MKLSLFILLSSVMPAQLTAASVILPDRLGDTSGFKALASQENYSSSDLYEYIDGGADVYIEAGMKSCAVRRYGDPKIKGSEFEVAAYDMTSPLNAFGIFRQLHTDRTRVTGTESAVQPFKISFWKSSWYIEVLDKSSKQADVSVLKGLACSVADRIPGDTLLPKEIKYLPDTLKKTSSERYWKSGFLSRSFLSGVLSGVYQAKAGTCTLFVMFCPTESLAVNRLDIITREFDGDNPRVQAFASKNRLVGCVGCTRNDFENTFFNALLDRIRRQQ